MNRKAGFPDAAWQCLLYLTSRPSLLTLFEEAGRFPSRRWLYRGSGIEKEEEGRVFGEASTFTGTCSIPPEWPEIARILVETLNDCFAGNKSAEEGLKDAQRLIKKAM